MDESKRNLKGSESRDDFKRWHKDLPPWCYATDLDLILISKTPERPIAAIDYKRLDDHITFTECIMYNWLTKMGVDVYLFSSDPIKPPYNSISVSWFAGGDPKPEPPVCNLVPVLAGVTEKKYYEWENELRNKFARGECNV